MDYAHYYELTQQAAKHDEAGDHEAALAIFLELLASDISDLDKSMMGCNVAVIMEKLDREADALAAYDRAIDYERRHARHFVAEHKAAYLHRLGRHREALRLYEDLARHPAVTEEEKLRFAHNIAALRQVAG